MCDFPISFPLPVPAMFDKISSWTFKPLPHFSSRIDWMNIEYALNLQTAMFDKISSQTSKTCRFLWFRTTKLQEISIAEKLLNISTSDLFSPPPSSVPAMVNKIFSWNTLSLSLSLCVIFTSTRIEWILNLLWAFQLPCEKKQSSFTSGSILLSKSGEQVLNNYINVQLLNDRRLGNQSGTIIFPNTKNWLYSKVYNSHFCFNRHR